MTIKRLNKRGIIIETVIRILIAIVLVVLVLQFGAKLYKVFIGGQGPKSFYGLVDSINRLEPNEKDAYALTIDDRTMILGFNKGSEINYYWFEGTDSSTGMIEGIHHCFIYLKPSSCDENKACLCLFEEFSNINNQQQYNNLKNKYPQEWCESQVDNEYSFWESTKSRCENLDEDITLAGVVTGLEQSIKIDYQSNGLKISRGLASKLKTAPIYLERYQSIIKACNQNEDCITTEEKISIDQQINEQNRDQAIAKFIKFIDEYNKCVKETTCSSLTLDLSGAQDYFIIHKKDGTVELYQRLYKEYNQITVNNPVYNSIKILRCDTTKEEEDRYYNGDVINIIKKESDYCLEDA